MAGTRSSDRKRSRSASKPSSASPIPIDFNSDKGICGSKSKLESQSSECDKSEADAEVIESGTVEEASVVLDDEPPTVLKSRAASGKPTECLDSDGCAATSATSADLVLVDDDAIQLALQTEIVDPATTPVADDEDATGDEDWAAEEKKLRDENRRRQEEERKKTKKMSSREKVQLLDNLLQKAAAYSAFLRGRMQEAVAGTLKPQPTSVGDVQRDPRQPQLVTGATMRKYQVEGVLWMASLYENGLNGILADEMGLGKTLQTIAFIAHLCEQKVFGPFLIVAPLSTIQNWKREFSRFTPSIPTVVYHGSKEERKEIREQMFDKKGQQWPVVITSFEVAMNDAKILARLPKSGSWKYLVVDEGHRLKNKDCRLLRELKALPTDNRLLLSGTPLQNNLTELWSLLNFILPQIFTDLSTFQNWFDFEDDLNAGEGAKRIIAEEKEHKTISKLHTILDPFLLRRLKTDVELCLPDKREYLVYAPWTPTQIKINCAIAERKLEELCSAESSGGFKPGADGTWGSSECIEKVNDKATSLQNIMMQMRKCCNHPYLFQAPKGPGGNVIIDERLVNSAGKLQLLDRILPVLKSRQHKDYLEYRKYQYERIDGTVHWKERQDRMDSFNGGDDSFVFLLSTRAGGIGINLVAADTVIFYDSDWNPQQDLQAQDRCHRIGQTKPVLVLRMLTINSIESHIYERACGKRKLELVAIARKRFKVADKVEHGAKIEDLEAAGKEKRGFVAQVRESLSAEELTELLRERCVAETCNENVINDADLECLLTKRQAGGVADQGRGWLCVTDKE